MSRFITILAAIALLFATSCSRSTETEAPPRPDRPDGTERPGVNPDNEHDAFLADGTYRYESAALTLRYSTPGVLVSTDGKGTSSITDIDRNRSFSISLSGDRTSATVTIDGHTKTVSVRVLREEQGTLWIISDDFAAVVPVMLP